MFKKNNNNKKKAKAAQAQKSSTNTANKDGGIIGLLLLAVVLSVAFSSYVVWFGTTGYVPKIMLAPQIVFAGIVLIKKFNK